MVLGRDILFPFGRMYSVKEDENRSIGQPYRNPFRLEAKATGPRKQRCPEGHRIFHDTLYLALTSFGWEVVLSLPERQDYLV